MSYAHNARKKAIKRHQWPCGTKTEKRMTPKIDLAKDKVIQQILASEQTIEERSRNVPV